MTDFFLAYENTDLFASIILFNLSPEVLHLPVSYDVCMKFELSPSNSDCQYLYHCTEFEQIIISKEFDRIFLQQSKQ